MPLVAAGNPALSTRVASNESIDQPEVPVTWEPVQLKPAVEQPVQAIQRPVMERPSQAASEAAGKQPEQSVVALDEEPALQLRSAGATQKTTVNQREVNVHHVDHEDDLPDFSNKLYNQIDIAPSLKHRLCPINVSVDTNKKLMAIVMLQSEFNTDLVEHLVKDLGFKGWHLDRDAIYIVPPSVMDKLARDDLNENKKHAKKATRKENGALWELFASAVTFAIENQASDIHVRYDRKSPKSRINFRIDGRITRPRKFEIESARLLDMTAYVYNVHSNSGSETSFNENTPQQCQITGTFKGVDVQLRWASNKTSRGMKVVMRVIPQDSEGKVRTLEELGYLPMQIACWKRAISRLGGGTLIAGVVGSGKSTTIQAVMAMMPDWMAKYSAEDPVENQLRDTDQFSVSRGLSDDESDPFLAVKRQTKRMDPDVVMIGEIRDRQSASLFRDIAESGHRAFSTVHAPSAIDMITLRLVSDELGIPRDVIATPNFINLLVYQALVPKLCEHCKVDATSKYDEEYLSRIERLFDIDRSKLKAENTDGCPHCRREGLPELNGSKGRIVVAEMIEPTAQMLLYFRESKNLELKQHIRRLRKSRFDEPDSTGKSALEVAMYHVARGIMDPAQVETKFGSFVQYEAEWGHEIAAARSGTRTTNRRFANFAIRKVRRPVGR